MVITVVCDVLGQENNGTTIAAMNLIRSMRAKGHEVRVVCPDDERLGQPGFYVVPRMNFYFLNEYVRKNGVCIAKPDDRVLRQAISGADVVHLVTPFFLARRALRIALDMGIPVTASFHCQAENFTAHIFMMDSREANRMVYNNFYRSVYRYCDAVHYPTQFIRDVFESQVGHTNGYVISNGVNSSFFDNRTEPRAELDGMIKILFTGRYSKEKCHKVLIDGAARSKYADRIQLIFAGDGPLKEELTEYSRERLRNMPVMRFYSRNGLLDVLRQADLYVHPAKIEIEAISCLEALASGLVPVIADSPRSATRHFALGENNLFRSGDADSLAERIDWWIEHPEERVACSLAYKDYSRRFEYEACMDGMEKMLTDACGARKTAAEPAARRAGA